MGSDETVALTAFVVIALHHGLDVFQDDDAKQLKNRVVRKPCSVLPARPSLPREPGHAGSGLCSLLGSHPLNLSHFSKARVLFLYFNIYSSEEFHVCCIDTNAYYTYTQRKYNHVFPFYLLVFPSGSPLP